MNIIRKLAKLMLILLTLPLLFVVWLLKWFVLFLHCCSAWIFYLLGSIGNSSSFVSNGAVARVRSTSNADWRICAIYDTTGGRRRGGTSGTGGSNASAGMVHIRCPPRIACLWNCTKKQRPSG